MAERLVSGDLQQEDQDVSLRPKRLEDFVGVDPVIVDKNTRKDLREFLSQELAEESCDHTYFGCQEWALKQGLEPLGVSRFLYERNMKCDCQVLAEGK